jgi:diguanylate cyclase (GGDEF)-like protein
MKSWPGRHRPAGQEARMRIRTLFLVCMSALALMTASLGGWLLWGAVTQYTVAGRAQRALDVDGMLLVIAEKLSMERPPSGDALFDDAVASEATRARIAEARATLDGAIARAMRWLAVSSSPGAGDQAEILRQVAGKMPVWRDKIDKEIVLPRSQRDPGTLAGYLESFKPLQADIDRALDRGDNVAAQQDGMMAPLVELARRAWLVRILVAARTAPMLASITTNVPLTGPQIEKVVGVQAMLAQNWDSIEALTRRLSVVPGLAEAVASARAAFQQSDDVHRQAFDAGREGGTYPVTALGYARNGVAGSMAAFAIRDAALAAALTRTTATRHGAALGVAAAAAVVLLSMLATAGVLVLLTRRIVVPVLSLTEVIGRIARNDFNVAIPARDRTDEIGRMAVALDALRAGAMAGEEHKAQIVHMARHDGLTGLPNRLMLREALEQAVAMAGRGQASAVLCLDLDRFKAVNDTFGHPTGDLLLKAVAKRLLACVRDVDTVSRLGGDEFAILLAGLDQPEQAAVFARRIVRSLSQPFELDGHNVRVGTSIGIALTPRDTTAAVTLLKCADTALYRAKQEEKGGWRFFRPEMDEHLQERMALERDLREAVQNEAFELAFQPQYTLARDPMDGDRLCGFEALLRWRHPVRGMVGPAMFVPTAEETGLIVPIGAWVLRHACFEAMHWPDDVRLAVNLSGVQFRSQDLVRTVRQALADSGLPAARLELEITETVLLNNSAGNLATLHELHDMGIHIAMDDFGTGYSSLSYLRSFPFDTIKIDRSFVRDLSDDPGARAIVRAVVALSRSLGMTTTAEGVETQEQLAELRRQGCTDVQGYLFSKPIWAVQARQLASRVEAGIQAA